MIDALMQFWESIANLGSMVLNAISSVFDYFGYLKTLIATLPPFIIAPLLFIVGIAVTRVAMWIVRLIRG